MAADMAGTEPRMDDGALVLDMAERLFSDVGGAAAALQVRQGEWPAEAWAAVSETGLPLALVPEEAGGVGLALEDGLAVIRLAAAHALPLPLAETMLSNFLLAKAGLEPSEGPSTFVSAQGERVPWGRWSAVVLAEDASGNVRRIGTPPLVARGTDLAGMPRDRLDLTADRGAPSSRAPLSLAVAGAAMRTIQIAGALDAMLALTLTYAAERRQFGRTLSAFQVIQHDIARLASEASAASAAADIAVAALAADGDPTRAVAAGFVRAGEAAGEAAAIAHQLHGAIGFTAEHKLHNFSRAIWSSRDDYGGHPRWANFLGKSAIAAGSAGYWRFVTETV